jgi:hypothetical protein
MIATQRIKSTSIKPTPYKDYEAINVLKWSNSRWKSLCPYYLKTDGNEECVNPGGILFENFYQGLKVYPMITSTVVYASWRHTGNPKYLRWKYETVNTTGDYLINPSDGSFNKDLYLRWRTSLWSCPNPIRYPNNIHKRGQTKFSLCIDSNGNETKMDYITARKKMYVREYIRLVKQLPEYASLLSKLKAGKNIMLCELDVPATGKKGLYGKDVIDDVICTTLTIEKLEAMMNDGSEAFGHGLCLAYALLLDTAY